MLNLLRIYKKRLPFTFQYDGLSKLPMKLPHDSQVSNVPHIKEDIGTVTIRFNQKTTLKKLEQLLQQLLWDDEYKPLKILRLKANVNIVKENDQVEGVLVQGASCQIYILFISLTTYTYKNSAISTSAALNL